MKLAEYVAENPDATLEQIQAVEVVVDKKQVGSGEARAFFVGNGSWGVLKKIQADYDHILFAMADAVVVTASDGSSYFGLDVETPEGVFNRAGADALVAGGILTEDQKLEFLAKSLRTIRPYADATEQSVLEAKLKGVTQSTETGYPFFDSTTNYHVKGLSDKVRITAVLDEAIAIDTTVSVFPWVDDQDTKNYSKLSRPYSMVIPKGYTQISTQITASTLSRFSQFTGTSDTKTGFRLIIKAI